MIHRNRKNFQFLAVAGIKERCSLQQMFNHARMSRRKIRLGLTKLVVGVVMPSLMGKTNIARLFPNYQEYLPSGYLT